MATDRNDSEMNFNGIHSNARNTTIIIFVEYTAKVHTNSTMFIRSIKASLAGLTTAALGP